ncbi:MAG: DUF4160 domain-containing protein [Bdellovibrionaceae bacterium]|nr:DUF4160 domain-containing protein [Pseudobdellovibrionaceae bacterium]
MPTLLIVKALRFMLHTREHGFPHVTVYHGTPRNHEAFAKVRLDRVLVIESFGFHPKDLNIILLIVEQYRKEFLEAWNDWVESQG